MHQRPIHLIAVLGMLAMILAACAGQPATTVPPPAAPTAASTELNLDAWDSVVAAARGQTLNWYMWGGSESINRFVDEFYGKPLAERYGITLNRVPLADAVDAVNQVLSEKEAGITAGAVDLIWINGENFRSLKQAAMLLPDWSRRLPNAALVDWENPALYLDFGEPVEGYESPWSSAQFQFIYDTARMDEDELPRSYAELLTWAQANPGRFTYIAPGPGAFQGTRFVKGALFELSGDAQQWLAYDEAIWQQWSPELWAYLNTLKPFLWREGATYPKDENELHSLFANGEVDFSITQAIAGAGSLINEGLVPATARAFVFDDFMIGDFNYLAIPRNASNQAAALVLANLILEPELQAAQILPANGFGLGYAIDVTRVSDPAQRAALDAAQSQLGTAATPAEDLANALVGDSAGVYQTLVEEGWREQVLIGTGQ
ncbi:MAG: ABC transporter substrate-binding protein [Candidatus Viridilinea halotolerans]|uniref:ABC transporter substrate-binding protein n=1 Tax=Candidatus Viridilinea halotolerans TaxID=2491704 RepID=A0A426TWG5_9CHLR|nr:MAG: ABC transporter substrate-binding protein [Candidatus Viridilinea halotolerans]